MAENVGKRGDTWFYRLELPAGPDGRRRQKRVGGFRTEREARRALATASVAVAEGRLRYAPSMTVEKLADEWLSVVTPNRKETTAANYAQLVRAYILPGIGTRRLDRLSMSDVQRFYADLRTSGSRGGGPLSGTQVRNVHRVLHNMLNYARRMGCVAVNPADGVEKPKEDTAERSVYSPEQVREFLSFAADDRLYALWLVALTTGLRRAELAGLRWTDLDLNGAPPTLTVRVSRTTAGQRVVETSPKTKAGKRVIVLDKSTVRALMCHRDRMASEADDVGATGFSQYVFVDEVGQPYQPVRLLRLLHALQRRAGLPEITLHDLRHTAATIALLAGVHPKVVSERHGHASTVITLDRYSHVLGSMQAGAAESIGRFISK